MAATWFPRTAACSAVTAAPRGPHCAGEHRVVSCGARSGTARLFAKHGKVSLLQLRAGSTPSSAASERRYV
ncbi:MAG: hypothetical protein WAK86_06190 [Pseudonocardiaceae bacterium]